MSPQQSGVREQLLELGVPPYLVTMAIPFMFFTPGAIDPDSPSIIEIIKGLQRGLRRAGQRGVRESGVFDRATVAALNRVSPPAGSYLHKTWTDLYRDVLAACRRGSIGLGSYYEFSPPVGPFPGSTIGTVPGALGATAVDAGVSLTWGLGIRDKSNCVPIPKSSGPTFEVFRDLQRQINRLLPLVKGGRIGEDGILGPGTLNAIRKLEPIFMQSLPAESCSQVAAQANTLSGKFAAEADQRAISPNANKGSSVTKTSVAEAPGKPVSAAELPALSVGGGVGSALKKFLPFLLVAGGVAFFAVHQRKKKSKKKGAK